MRQNIQYDQTLMVPALFCEDVSQAQKSSHARLLTSYAPMDFSITGGGMLSN
jgi:hypothetical protein